MNATSISRKLAAAGFQRSSYSAVKGRGRARRTDGFRVSENWQGGFEVSVKDYRSEIADQVHQFVLSLGFVEVERMGSIVRYDSISEQIA